VRTVQRRNATRSRLGDTIQWTLGRPFRSTFIILTLTQRMPELGSLALSWRVHPNSCFLRRCLLRVLRTRNILRLYRFKCKCRCLCRCLHRFIHQDTTPLLLDPRPYVVPLHPIPPSHSKTSPFPPLQILTSTRNPNLSLKVVYGLERTA
jgi:hypothetical protein